MIAADRSLVGTLRIRDPLGDPVATRMRAELQLGTLALRPPGLPPAAVLVIRGLSDPLPGRLRLASGELHPPDEWAAALQSSLAVLARRARRPAWEEVPSTAEAVVFADRAELLACLASDWRRGLLRERWWWRGPLLPAGPPATAALGASFSACPEDAPAAFELLAKRGEAVDFVARLAPAEGRAVGGRVAAAFGAEWLAGVLGVADLSARRAPRSPPAAPGKASSDPREMTSGLVQAVLRIVPEALRPDLSHEQRALLALVLLVARRPDLARTREPSPAAVPGPAPTSRWPRQGRSEAAALVPSARPHPRRGRRRLRRQDEPHGGAPGLPPKPDPPGPSEGGPAIARRRAAGPAGESEASERRDGRVPRRRQPGQPPPVRASGGAVAPRMTEVMDAPLGDLIETELGGLFHLLNLALHLELYGDFSRPVHRAIDLDPWALVALLGERLLGEAAAPADPVWALLASWAGREAGQVPESWRPPPGWLDPFEAERGPLRWAARSRRLLVLHPAGFALLDVPLGRRRARAALAKELAPYGPRPLRRSRAGPRAAGWLDHLAAYTRARLVRALAVDEPQAAVRLLLRRHARVWTTATDVDVEFALADLPLAVRLSGLDRDPGWVPAARRHVRYRFR